MKKYSCNQAQRGKTAYRTPDRFIAKASHAFWKVQVKKKRYGKEA